MLKIGLICDIDLNKGMARVNFQDDDIVSNWMPIAVIKATGDKIYFPFDINEQVYCLLDDSGETGVIAGALYNETNLPPTASKGDLVLSFDNGAATIKYERNTKKISIQSQGDVEVTTTKNIKAEAGINAEIKAVTATLEATANAKVKGSFIMLDAPIIVANGTLNVTGALTAASVAAGGFSGASGGAMQASSNIVTTGDVIAGGKSLTGHVHTSASSGSPTSPPL